MVWASIISSPRTSTTQTKWWTYHNVTRVIIWDLDYFKNNVRLFMAMKALDLGLDYYCVLIRNLSPIFSNFLFLFLMFLPYQKICVHSYYGPPFGGPFDKTVFLSQIWCRDILSLHSHGRNASLLSCLSWLFLWSRHGWFRRSIIILYLK